MADKRKKVILYLHPDLYEQDALAEEFIVKLPSALRGEFYRQCLVVGSALASIDPRLLQVISVMYSKSFDANQLSALIEQVTGHSLWLSQNKRSDGEKEAPDSAPVPENTSAEQRALDNLKKFKR